MKSKKGKKIKKRLSKNDIENGIVKFLSQGDQHAFNYKQLCKLMEITAASERQMVIAQLYDLEARGIVVQVSPGKYRGVQVASKVTGKLQINRNGSAFLIADDEHGDVFISDKNMGKAMSGDLVRAHVYASRRGRSREGEVIEVIKCAREQYVGIVEVLKNFAFLVCEHKHAGRDIFIPLDKLNGAKNGQKAIGKITDWPTRAKNPYGEIISVLGDVGDNQTEMHAILAEFDLPHEYPQEVVDYAETISAEITPQEISKRRDFRSVTTFTIDPKDAKDFDDALSIQKLPNGHWEIGVHIADVTHYVKPGNILFEEAERRATSVYLVDRVIPMLPERLSNFICSLRPDEEKLCYSVVFTMDNNAQVVDSWIGRTVIQSNRRFTYEEAQELIEGASGDYQEEILTMNRLAEVLRAARFQSGAISFERAEVRFNIDETGKPLGVYYKVSKEANKLVEEFMLLANKYVAESVGKTKAGAKPAKTFIYRIHDVPNPDKLETFSSFITRFGRQLKIKDGKVSSTAINTLLDEVKGSPEQNLIDTLAIRSMSKAIYTTHNIGHYGLAFEYYSHFTSPIRRYPDMMVHRLLDEYAHGAPSANEEEYEKECEHSSEMEQRASNAERASIKYKQVEFMGDKIGQNFVGVISGVTEWGIFVELSDNMCEGLVSTRDMADDFYEFDQDTYCIIGKRSGKTYRLGDQVSVEVLRANLEKRQLDFALSSEK